MQAWLLSIWQELDKTIIFITHDLEEACYLSDRIILLKDDRTIEETTVPLPRPRYQEMLHSQILLELRKELEKRFNMKNLLKQYSLFIVFVVLIMVLVEYLVRSKIVPAFIIPAPTSVANHIVEQWRPLIFEHLKATMSEFSIGFIIAVTAGVGLAVSMYFSKTIEKMLYPAVLISQMIPIIALSPIFVLWFGYSIWSKVAVTVLMSFFPIVVATYDGLKSCDKDYIELLRSMGANKRQIFMKLNIPMALPSFFFWLENCDCLLSCWSNHW